MKRFFISTLYFLLAFSLLNIAFYFLCSRPIYFNDYNNVVKNVINERPSKLIIGDSRAQRLRTDTALIDMDVLREKRIGNIAYGSDNFSDMYLKLYYILDKNINLDTCLLEMDDHLFSSYRDRTNNYYRSFFFSDYNVFRRVYNTGRFEYLVRKYILTFYPLINRNNSKIFRDYIFPYLNEKMKKESTWNDLTADERMVESERRAKQLFGNNMISKVQMNAFQKIVELCKENEIVLVGIKYPIDESFKSSENKIGFVAPTNLNTSVERIVDLESFFFNNLEYMANQDHINDKGVSIVMDTLYKARIF